MGMFFDISLYHYLILALLLFCIGVWGVIVAKNAIKVLILLELMLNAVALNFAAFACYLDKEQLNGLVVALFIVVFGAAQVALGGALLVSIYKYRKVVDVEQIGEMRG